MHKEEAKKKIEKWLSQIPKSEVDVPYFEIKRRDGSQLISPKKAIDKLSKNQKVLNYIAADMVDKLDSETETPVKAEKMDDIILPQFKARINNINPSDRARVKFGLASNGKLYGVDDMLAEMEKQTEIGSELKNNFKNFYIDMVSKLET